jgi:DNA-binding MarR family transcriptional regulator
MASPREEALTRQHLANVIGAFVTACADEMRTALDRDARAGGEAAAIAALQTWPDESVEFLARVLGLTHSGTVRLVDRLVDAGLARRRAGRDRRSVAVSLTANGRAAARRVREARTAMLMAIVDALTPAERDVMERALERLLRQKPRSRPEARHACRLCDHSVCRGEACPIGESVPAA